MLSQNLNVLCNISSKKEKSRVPRTGILEGCKPGKKKTNAHFPSIETGNVVVSTSLWPTAIAKRHSAT